MRVAAADGEFLVWRTRTLIYLLQGPIAVSFLSLPWKRSPSINTLHTVQSTTYQHVLCSSPPQSLMRTGCTIAETASAAGAGRTSKHPRGQHNSASL